MPFTLLDPATAAAAPATTVGAPLTSVGETLLSMRTWLLEELANRTDIDTTKLNIWINQAYKDVAGMMKPLELDGNISFSLVTGQPLYNIPSVVSFLRDIALSDPTDFLVTQGRVLDKIDLATYRRLGVLQSTPRTAFRFGRMLVFWPTPDKAYSATADFKADVAPLANDTDSPILQPALHLSIMLRSKRHALRSLKLYAEAGMAQNDFLEEIRPMLNTDAEESASVESSFQPAKSYSQLYNDED